MTYFVATCTLVWLACRLIHLFIKMVKSGWLIGPVDSLVFGFIHANFGPRVVDGFLIVYNLFSLSCWVAGFLCILATFSPAMVLCSSVLLGAYMGLALTQVIQLRIAGRKLAPQVRDASLGPIIHQPA